MVGIKRQQQVLRCAFVGSEGKVAGPLEIWLEIVGDHRGIIGSGGRAGHARRFPAGPIRCRSP